MTDHLPIPPNPVPIIEVTTPPEAKRARVIGRYMVDAVGIIALVVLTVYAKLDVNIAAVIIAIIAGVNISDLVKRGGGVGGGGLLLVLAQGVIEGVRRYKGVAVALLMMTTGCGAGSASALKIIAPLAAEVIRHVATEKGIEIDENGAMCVPLDDEYGDIDVPGVFAICWAPEMNP